MALGIGVTTAVATLSLSVGDRMARELRSFGANISVTPAADSLSIAVGGVDYRPAGAGAFLPESDLANLRRDFLAQQHHGLCAVSLRPRDGQGPPHGGDRKLVQASLCRCRRGDVFQTGLEELHPAWKVQGDWPHDGSRQCLVGAALARQSGCQARRQPHFPERLEIPPRPWTWPSAEFSTPGARRTMKFWRRSRTVQKFTGLEGKSAAGGSERSDQARRRLRPL